jgi:hypothetical protein
MQGFKAVFSPGWCPNYENCSTLFPAGKTFEALEDQAEQEAVINSFRTMNAP